MRLTKNAKRSLFFLYSYFIQILHIIFNLLPPVFRSPFFKIILKKTGKKVFIDYGVYFRFPNKIVIGNEVTINRNCSFYPSFFNKESLIEIGDNVRIGPQVTFLSGTHDHRKIDLPDFGKGIRVENHVWVGGSSVIMPGVTIKEGAVIGAGSIVTKDVDPYTIVAGNPAKFIKKRVIEDDPL